MTKDKADYVREAKKEFCKDCVMFLKPNKCSLVEGDISPQGHCKYWEITLP